MFISSKYFHEPTQIIGHSIMVFQGSEHPDRVESAYCLQSLRDSCAVDNIMALTTYIGLA